MGDGSPIAGTASLGSGCDKSRRNAGCQPNSSRVPVGQATDASPAESNAHFASFDSANS